MSTLKSKQVSHKRSFFGTSRVDWLIRGQGVLYFRPLEKARPKGPLCKFYIYNDKRNDGLKVKFYSDGVHVSRISNRSVYADSSGSVGFIDMEGAYYWFSLDFQNTRLFAGVGEARMETTVYQHSFSAEEYNEIRLFLEGLTHIDAGNIRPMKVLSDPITRNVPLLLKDTHSLTMNDIALGTFLPNANLSTIGRKLYDCVSGDTFVLNDADFPDFSRAIEHSIATDGCWCHTKLQEKSTEFNKDNPNLLETYLRITLGENNGESPGVPYVMEIWPVGHYSPIHSHSNANAIIRVLHGSIHVRLYSFLCPQKDLLEPFGEADFKEGDITWISPSLNQTHQLKNLVTNLDTCITIQCYMYDQEDQTHYEYFDYLDEKGQKVQYEPDSDMDFVLFKQLIKQEWEQRKCN